MRGNRGVPHSSEIHSQIAGLEVGIVSALCELRLVSAALENTERELDDFLKKYYRDASPLFTEFLQSGAYMPSSPWGKDGASEAIVETVARSLYRKLVKRCHPDAVASANSSADPDASVIFGMLMRSYARRDVREMIAIERALEKEENAEEEDVSHLERLERELDGLLNETDRCKYRLHAVQSSDAFQLMLCARQYRSRCGEDLMAGIKIIL